MTTAVNAGWLEWKDGDRTQRTPLRAGLTLIGGVDGDIPCQASGSDQLQVWDDPPKLVLVGAGGLPRVGSREGSELTLEPGDVIRWHDSEFAFGCGGLARSDPYATEPAHPSSGGGDEAALEEFDLGSTGEQAALPRRVREAQPRSQNIVEAVAGIDEPSKPDAVAWARVKAGLFVELGIADPHVTRVWQQSIARGEFDANACTRDVLRVSHFPESDPRLVERCSRLERDLIMSPLQAGARGASRRAKRAAKGGLAFLVAQLAVMLVFTAILAVMLLVARIQWDFSVDALLDGFRALIPG